MSITLYVDHEMNLPESMDDVPDMDATLNAAGHDFTERTFVTQTMDRMFLVTEFPTSADLVAHFEILQQGGLESDGEIGGGIGRILSCNVVGDLDDEARRMLEGFSFVHFMSELGA
jgi:hypothetical protein